MYYIVKQNPCLITVFGFARITICISLDWFKRILCEFYRILLRAVLEYVENRIHMKKIALKPVESVFVKKVALINLHFL